MTNFRSLVAGGFFSSDPNDRSVPVAIRTNNPGALNTAAWIRALPGFVSSRVTTPGNATAVFEAPEYGVAAWWELLHRYRDKMRPADFTLGNIIRTYCGRGREREAVEYTAFVAGKSGVPATQKIDIGDAQGLLGVARAFFWYEAGRQSPLKDAQVLYGLDLGQRHAAGATPASSLAVSALSFRAVTSADATAAAVAAAPGAGRRSNLVDTATAEAKKKLKWSSPNSEAEKYLKPFREPMRRLGQIGSKPVWYNWCAALVTWCCRQSGYTIPDQPMGYDATMALVAAWEFWGEQQNLVAPPKLSGLQAGDILLYHWPGKTKIFNHIGVFRRPLGGNQIEAAEGNAGNSTAITKRNFDTVRSVIRLPD